MGILLDLKALLNKILGKVERRYDITSAVSITQGTVDQINMTIFYDATDVRCIYGRIVLAGLTLNSRPAITVDVPTDMPTCAVFGASTIRGSSSVATDAPIFNHTYGSSTATITMGWTIGTAPAGYATMTF